MLKVKLKVPPKTAALELKSPVSERTSWVPEGQAQVTVVPAVTVSWLGTHWREVLATISATTGVWDGEALGLALRVGLALGGTVGLAEPVSVGVTLPVGEEVGVGEGAQIWAALLEMFAPLMLWLALSSVPTGWAAKARPQGPAPLPSRAVPV